jgi:hypothetical protein
MPTRFKNPTTGLDGPVSGSLQIITIPLAAALATNTSYIRQTHFPPGVGFEVTDVRVWCGTVGGDPEFSIGTAAAGEQIVAKMNLATGNNVPTIVDGTVAAGGIIDVRIVNDSGDSVALGAQPPATINIFGYITSPPTSMGVR